MDKKLREQLENRAYWLKEEHAKYDKEDFIVDFKEFTQLIDKLYYMELISKNVFEKCKEVLYDFFVLCF